LTARFPGFLGEEVVIVIVREILAKRISGAREYVVGETPILKEIPIHAHELEHRVHSFRMEGITTPEGLLDWFKDKGPIIESGKAYGEEAGQWYRVTFSQAIPNPQVVAVAEARGGEISTKDVKRAPSVGIPSVSIAKPSVSIAKPSVSISAPTVSISIPTVSISKVEIRAWHCKACDFGWFSLTSQTSCLQCGSSNIEEITYGNKYEWTGWYLSLWNAKRQLGDWKWGMYIGPYWAGFDLNWIRDMVATAWAWFGYYFIGRSTVFILFDAMGSQVDKVREGVQNAINEAISNVKAGVQSGINTSIANVRDSTQSSFNTAIDNVVKSVQDAINKALDNSGTSVQTAFNTTIDTINSRIPEQTDYIRDRINERLNDLYAMWGLPEKVALTVAHIRNITSAGFEFLSLGETTIHWIAVGG
jgi:hypothetical protein